MTIDELIAKWWGKKGGQERSNFAPFITDLCLTLGLELPGQAEAGKLGAYEYEGSVPGGSFRSLKASGSIDLYKRGCFVMEAKQSQLPPERQKDLGLFEPAETAPRAPSGARYDQLMRDARAQAENYAKNLPGDHPPAPFILICDIGRAFEIEFDYTGNGRGYGFFPDKQRYRIELPALASTEKIRGVDCTPAELLRAIWLDPDSVNPRFQTADVTTGVARRLAQVSQYLEAANRSRAREAGPGLESQAIEETSLFLMRIIFCMFAENIGLLPDRQFEAFLKDTIEDQTRFEQGLHDLWTKMNTPGGGFAWAVNGHVQYFNGGLFESDRTYVISNADRGELYQAARAKWTKVEPAIFGTLLEQALTKEERAKLGAHYTPRPYVERLVQATIMDVLEAEWAEASASPSPSGEGTGVGPVGTPAPPSGIPHPNPSPEGEGLKKARAFHDRIAALRILDPACGTGNFLYVAMEALQQLEARVIETIETLGGSAEAKVGPHQFFGLELNPRAAKIAELVLWIGWLRFRLANDPADVDDPVLDRTANINFGRAGGYDAVLAQTETGGPDLENPRVPAWPEADFIIGNPPFIGGKDIRGELGGEYAEALWQANPHVPASADFVTQWWDRAADLLTAPNARLRRFGFVTTNSVTQTFSRRVIERHLVKSLGEGRHSNSSEAESEGGLHLVLACPDHPWTKETKDAAAVRIAMTVAEAGPGEGRLIEIEHDAGLDTDEPDLRFSETLGEINANLSIGPDPSRAKPLFANEGIASPGIKLHGAGFIVTPSEARALGLGSRKGLEDHIRPYRHGRDLLGRSRGVMVIDLYGLSEVEVRQRFPEVYQHLLTKVRNRNWDEKKKKWEGREEVVRQANEKGGASKDALSYLELWWLHGKPRPELRAALAGLSRYIATVETAKHRTFQFVDVDILPDNKLTVIATEHAYHLGILSSRTHRSWYLANAGRIGVFNQKAVWVKSACWDPFPFADATGQQRSTIAELAEELDAARNAALAEVPQLTMTEIYNLRERIAAGERLERDDLERATAARSFIVHRLHEQLDAAVAAAYGWPADLTPSEIVARLVALNAERAAEEKAGHVRWLRPDYQIPRFAAKDAKKVDSGSSPE